MCGRFAQYSDPEDYASYFAADALLRHSPATTSHRPNRCSPCERTNGARELVPLRWGLVPSWSKGPDSRFSMINARAETVDSKPAYRNAFKHRRCLIPSEGFYEWKAGAQGKTPYLIRRTDGAPFGMAGLWETWRDPDGEPLESCTMIVTDANDLVRNLHDRMPVILSREDYDAWLDPDTKDRRASKDPPAGGSDAVELVGRSLAR